MNRIFATLLVLTLAACASQTRMASTPSAPLEGTTWMLSQLGGKQVAVGENQRQPYVQFNAGDRRAGGNAGCNLFSGGYALDGQTISFTETAVTRMACAQGMDIEAGFLNALRQAHGWDIDGSQLRLTDANGKLLAVLTARPGNIN